MCKPSTRDGFYFIFCIMRTCACEIKEKRDRNQSTYQHHKPKHTKNLKTRRSDRTKVNAFPRVRSNTYRSQKVSNLRSNIFRRNSRHTSRRSIQTQTLSRSLKPTIIHTSFSFFRRRRSSREFSSKGSFTRRNLRVWRRGQRSRWPSIFGCRGAERVG